MDITRATKPNSQQVNADDLDEPAVVTVTGAQEGTDEQPLYLSLAEFPGRTYRPSKGMARVIKAAWGGETDDWTGVRRLEIFRNPSIKFGPAVVGGIQISKISHIEELLRVNLTVSKGKKAIFTVQPFPAPNWLAKLDEISGDLDLIHALGTAAKNGGASTDVMGKIMTAYRAAEAAGKSVEAAAEEGAE